MSRLQELTAGQILLLCVRVKDWSTPTEGAQKRKCVGCDEEVWRSLSAVQSDPPGVYLCQVCAVELTNEIRH